MAGALALPRWRHWALALVIAVIGAALLYQMGRLPVCACGTVKLWHGAVQSAENSQHLTDWYSPSHVLHGLLFYLALHWLSSGWSLGLRLVVATLVETAWEVVENTDAVIERYRETTIALDYYGDSVINSMADIGMMWLGFVIAARAPVWISVALFVVSELVVGLVIRDGLVLNVVMLLWPVEALRVWQEGG